MISVTPDAILQFWMKEVGPDGWYSGGAALDLDMRKRFADAWEMARQGGLEHWRSSPQRCLAYLLLTDQFPRNMFRGEAQAFATDGPARTATKDALAKGWDLRTPEPQRQFFYMPLVHSECAADQDRAVRLILRRMPRTGSGNLLHARAHREVIRRFGRFPFRNAALGRADTEAEAAFAAAGGYGSVVQSLQA